MLCLSLSTNEKVRKVGGKMNQRILSTLGFDKVKQQLLQFIVTAQGTNEVSELLPIADENKFNHG